MLSRQSRCTGGSLSLLECLEGRVLMSADVAGSLTSMSPLAAGVIQPLVGSRAGVPGSNNNGVPGSNNNTDSPPVVSITAPLAGTTFQPGELISFAGRASDFEDGMLPASRFRWALISDANGRVRQLQPPIFGVDHGSFVVPSTLPTADPNQTIRIRLDVTDSAGNTSVTSVSLSPMTGTVNLQANFPGIQVRVGRALLHTPTDITGAVGGRLLLEAPLKQNVQGTTYVFSGWSDHGAMVHRVTVQAGTQTVFAVYRRVHQRSNQHFPPSGIVRTNMFSTTPVAASAVMGQSASGVLGQQVGMPGRVFA